MKQHGLTRSPYSGGLPPGVAPRIMGIGPVPACRKLMAVWKLEHDVFDVIELNEAFASQGLACFARTWRR